MQLTFNEMVQTVRSRENDKNLSAQRLEHLKEKENSLQEFLQKAGGQLRGIEESIQFTEAQVGEESQALEQLNQQLESLRQEVDAKRNILDEKRHILDNLRQEQQHVQRSQFDAEKKVAVADTSVQNLQRVIGQIEEERKHREEQRQHLDQERILKEKELSIKKVDLEQLQQHQENTREQILQIQSVLEGLRNELAEENRKLDSKKNEHDLLKSMIDSMEGYPDSVKFLHNNQQWNHTSPILSDVMYVKEEYRTALENVLEPYLGYYVVNNLQEGLQAVHLLDENKKGKANFFLLNKFDEQAPASIGHHLEGGIPALSVVEVEEKYRKLAEHLLSNVFIADNEQVLENSNGFVVIEKHGKYVKGKYSLTGGSVGLIEGKKIGRAKNLEKLQEEILTQSVVVEKLRADIQARHNEVIAFNEDLRENAVKETEREIQQLTNEVFALHNKLENLHSMQTSSQHRLEELNLQMQQTHQSVEGVRNQLTGFNEALLVAASRLAEADEAFRMTDQEYNESSRQYNEFNLNVTKHQSKIAGLRQELEFKGNQLNDLRLQIDSNGNLLTETAGSIEQATQTLRDTEEALLQLMRDKEVEEQKLNEADQAYYNLRNQLSEKESEIRHKVK